MRLRQLRDLAAAGRPTTFITLTVNPAHYDEPDNAAQALVKAWRNLLQRGKREGRFDHVPYLAVFEAHKSGWPHLHILARAPYIDQAWISDRMREYTGGLMADIRAVKGRRAASQYVAKYISKGPGRYDGTKRYWRSQSYQLDPTGWEKEQPVADRVAMFNRESIESLQYRFEKAGWLSIYHCREFIQMIRPDPSVLDIWLDAYVHQWARPPGAP